MGMIVSDFSFLATLFGRLMSTLSFSCPQCQKVHSRIKPELVGHKVKCQCGFVFRLGAKKDKQPGVDQELKRKRAAKQRRSEATGSATIEPVRRSPIAKPSKETQKPLPGPPLPSPPLDVEPIMGPIEVAGEVSGNPIGAGDEFLVQPILEIEPDTARHNEIPILEPISPGPLPVADFVPPANDIADPFLDPLDTNGQSQAGAPLSTGTPTGAPQPKKKRAKSRPLRAGEKRLDSMAGPTVSLIVSILGLIAMILVVTFLVFSLMSNLDQQALKLFMSDAQKSWLTFALIRTVALVAMGSLLALSVLASGVTAVMEMNQKRKIGWAHMTAAILAAIFMLMLLVHLVSTWGQFYSLANDSQFRVNKPKIRAAIFITILATIGMGIAPLAVAITGFIRGRK